MTKDAKKHRRSLKSKEKQRIRRRLNQGFRKEQKLKNKLTGNSTIVTAPKRFSFFEQPQATIQFINKLKNLYLKKGSVFVNLNNVIELEY